MPSECDYSAWSIEKLLPVACFSEGRLDCPWRPTVYWIEWAILGDTVTKCPSWVLHAQWDSVRVYGIVGMCTIYYLCNRKRQKIWEACHVPCPGQSLTKERGKGSEGVGRTRQMKESAEMRKCKRNGVSVLCPTGPELGGWQGSHYMRVSDSSLSHCTSQQLTLPPLWQHRLCNADYIITHHTYFNWWCGSICVLYVRRSNLKSMLLSWCLLWSQAMTYFDRQTRSWPLSNERFQMIYFILSFTWRKKWALL